MTKLWDGLVRLSHAAALAGCGLLFLAALIVTVEVLIRKAVPDIANFVAWITSFFGIQLRGWAVDFKRWIDATLAFSGSDEISGYLFAVGTSWAMAYVLVTRGHVRIDVLYGSFGPRIRAVLDIIALAFLIVFLSALVERAFDVATTNLLEYNRSNTKLRIPLAWAQLPWLAGIALFFLTAIVALVRSLVAFFGGDTATVNALIGASSQDEEIESELKGLGIEARHTGKA